MGINIKNGSVTYDGTHEKNLNTSTSKNPRTTIKDGIKVISIFQRLKDENRKDGNPLIHALKGHPNYRTTLHDIIQLSKNGRKIISQVPNHFAAPDFIIPVPSGTPINQMLSTRICRAYKNSPTIVTSGFRKSTLQEALNNLPRVEDIDTKLKKDFTSSLNTLQKGDLNAPIQMKLVKKSVSHYFSPILSTGQIHFSQDARILFVDDLYSSGTTLRSTISALNIPFRRGQVGAAVLLSPI